jgi:shikimate 5-dehydrogenase
MTTKTLYFVGVTTGKSSILKVFPRWCEVLGLDARIEGIDVAPNSAPEIYRDVVKRLRDNASSPGALITTHKLNVYQAAADLFDGISEDAKELEEINSVSKRDGRFLGHAKDPMTVGYSLEAIVPDGYWRATGAHMLVLGSGGSALALTLYLHNRQKAGGDVPQKLVVTARRAVRLEEMKAVHQRIGFRIPVEYRLAPAPQDGDTAVASLPEASMVINATGLGKDAPGSPISDAVVFPEKSIAWDFNYRGELIFLDQARAQDPARNVRIEDGWVYFVHGWTRVIAEVFQVDIPPSGALFDRLGAVAIDAS